MKLLLGVLFLCFFIIGEHYGQNCGTKHIDPPRGWEQHIQNRQARTSNQPIEILLKIHIVRRSSGTGGIALEDVLLGVNKASLLYQQAMNLTFKICPDIHYIDNTTLYNKEVDSTVLHDHFYPSKVSYAVDVFYAPITNPASDPFIISWAYFPWEPGDCIVMHNDMATLNVLAHEMGHYLGLFHTHDQTSLLTDNIPGNHDTRRVEYVDGTGCANRGDWICDTPADPGLSGRVTSDDEGNNCAYSGIVYYDLNGDVFVPNIFNIMSYTKDDCRTLFSDGQAQKMLSVLQNQKTDIYAYRNQPCPCESEPNSWVLEEVDYIGCKENLILWSTISNLPLIAANKTIRASNLVSSMANVSYQAGQKIILEPGFKVALGGVFKTQSQGCSLVSCNNNRPYVAILNDSWNSEEEISIQTKIEQIPTNISGLMCYPNPTNQRLNVVFNLDRLDAVSIELIDVNGRVVVQLKEQKLATGRQEYQLNTEALIAGVYMLVLRTDQQFNTKKILIQH